MIETNPYLKNVEKHMPGLMKFVYSSSAIEGIHVAIQGKHSKKSNNGKCITLRKSVFMVRERKK